MSSAPQAVTLRRFRLPQTVIGRFLTARTIRLAVIWGFVFGLLVLSSALTFAKAYPSEAARQQIATSFSGNAGFKMLIGTPNHMETVAGFTEWRVLGLTMIVSSIWGLLIATKTLRGNEDAGRWELLLSGQTTARRATLNALGALLMSVVLAFVLTAVATVLTGRSSDVRFSVGSSLCMALAAVASAAMFMSVGAFASQVMPVRARAAAMSATVFGVSFLLRGIGDVSSVHWLLNVSPLGWIEHLRPLSNFHPIWLVPIGLFIVALCSISLWIAGRRDLGASLLADHDTAKARTKHLRSPLGLAARLTRPFTLAWIVGILAFSTIFGSITKSAISALTSSHSVQQAIVRTTTAQTIGTKTFLGVAFFIMMTLVMAFVAASVSAAREDEAQGYLDNLLVRSVSRVRWLAGRVLLIGLAMGAVALLTTSAFWLSTHLQHLGITWSELFQAALNALAPALFLLGVGVFVLGFAPRITSAVLYGIIAWSFLMQMLGSFGNLSHWLLDTSLLHHIALAPAIAPRWGAAALLVSIGAVAALAGMLRFNSRDLANE